MLSCTHLHMPLALQVRPPQHAHFMRDVWRLCGKPSRVCGVATAQLHMPLHGTSHHPCERACLAMTSAA